MQWLAAEPAGDVVFRTGAFSRQARAGTAGAHARTRSMSEAGHGSRATIAFGLGAPALVLAWLALLPEGATPTELALAPLVVAGMAWAWSVARAERAAISWPTVVGGALLLRALAFVAAPATSDDALRYVWEGLVLLEGQSPYAFAPDAPGLAALRGRWPELAAGVNHSGTSAAYPPLHQAAGMGVVAVARVFGEAGLVERALALQRLFAAACDLCVLLALRGLLAARGVAPARAIAWAWSPLAALEFAGAGHMDAFGIALWIGGLALLERAGRARGFALVVGGALVKLLPALSLPFALRAMRAGRLRGLLVAALAATLAFAPLAWLEGGMNGLTAGLADYGRRWESTSLLYRFVEPPLVQVLAWSGADLDERLLGRGLCAVLWLALAARALRARADVVRGSWSLLAAFLVLSPTLHPWYLTWALPFLACFPSRAWSWLLALAPLAYTLPARWQLEGVWREPAWLWPVWALPFLALGLRERLRRR